LVFFPVINFYTKSNCFILYFFLLYGPYASCVLIFFFILTLFTCHGGRLSSLDEDDPPSVLSF